MNIIICEYNMNITNDFTSMYNHLEFRVYYREMYYQLIYHIRYSIHYLISDFNKFLMKERIR